MFFGTEAGQAEARDESGRLVGLDAPASDEVLRRGSRESRDASELPGEFPRCLQPRLPSSAPLQDECDEFLHAERVDSEVGETVSRVVEGFAR